MLWVHSGPITKISPNAQHSANPVTSVAGAITLYLYVAKFLTGEVHSDLNCEEDTLVNELNQYQSHDGMNSMSISRNTEYGNMMNTVPKQALDVVNSANKGNSGKTFPHHSEPNTPSTPAHPTAAVAQPMQVFSNIEIDGVLIRGKQDTGAEINAMPLNVYDQLNQRLHGNLELKPCGDIKLKGYAK